MHRYGYLCTEIRQPNSSEVVSEQDPPIHTHPHPPSLVGTRPKLSASVGLPPNRTCGRSVSLYGKCSPTVLLPTVSVRSRPPRRSSDDLFAGDMNGSEVYYTLKHGNRLDRPPCCPLSVYQIMLLCWKWDEKQRPTFCQLVRLIKSEFIDRPSDKSQRRSTTVFDEIHAVKSAEQDAQKIVQF